MEYLVRFAQVLETFRKPEIEALASLANVGVHWVAYDECVCWSSLLEQKNHGIPVPVAFFSWCYGLTA